MSGKPRRKISAPSGPVASVFGLFNFQKSASKAASQPSVDLAAASGSTASPGGSGRRAGGAGGSSSRRPEVHAEEDEDELDENNSAKPATDEGGSSDGECSGDSGDNSDEEEDDEEDEDDSSSAAASQGGAGSGKPSRLDKVRQLGKPAIHRSQSTGDSQGGASGTGCATGVAEGGATPAHALFLQHKQKARPRKSHEDGGESRDSAGGVYDGEDSRTSSGDSRKKKKSIGEKLNFLSRKSPGENSPTSTKGRAGDSSAASASEKSVRAVKPNYEQVQRWGNSFDSLLNDKYGLALFRAFLKTEYSDENIEFWVACEEYRGLTGPKRQALKAQKIYNEFVAFQAPREVNLDSTTRLATINAMGSPDRHLFEQAQKRIQALMEKDSYQRFLRSEVYQAHLRDTVQRDRTEASATFAAAAPAAAATASSVTS
ncbi:hypothetical protein BOX15_Mlig010798g2 [Macrostomum lignano]|uniref:RGS domain-containing protein n=2 Tax=Macrostomum lignano TaxID=282301 RepID=A0A1I8JC59_9PLAT|nr:hypothetical protein BOX15_Mlig010798g2 [Macrostomum lignano]